MFCVSPTGDFRRDRKTAASRRFGADFVPQLIAFPSEGKVSAQPTDEVIFNFIRPLGEYL